MAAPSTRPVTSPRTWWTIAYISPILLMAMSAVTGPNPNYQQGMCIASIRPQAIAVLSPMDSRGPVALPSLPITTFSTSQISETDIAAPLYTPLILCTRGLTSTLAPWRYLSAPFPPPGPRRRMDTKKPPLPHPRLRPTIPLTTPSKILPRHLPMHLRRPIGWHHQPLRHPHQTGPPSMASAVPTPEIELAKSSILPKILPVN